MTFLFSPAFSTQQRSAVDKSLPANLDAERATLGSVLLNREAIIAIAPWLAPDDFYAEQHAWVYEAALHCYNARVPPDIRTVSDELRRRERLDSVGGLSLLASLIDGVPTSYHVEYYAQIVQRTATLRRLIGAAGTIAALGYDEQDDVEGTLDRAEAVLMSVTQRQSRAMFVPLTRTIDDYFHYLVALEERGEPLVGVPSGFRDLDDLTGGLQKSDLIVLAARPSVGKSAAAMSIVYHLATQTDAKVGIFSLEMSREQLVQRLLAMDTGIDTHRLRNGHLRERELQQLFVAMGELAPAPVYIDDTPGLSIMDVRSKARRLATQHGVDLLVVDYLQLMRGRRQDNRVQEIGEIARGLKDLARELNIPIIALAQLNRAVENRASHIPLLSALRESGELEQAADIVILLYREELYNPDTNKKGIVELHIAKHRNGPVGIVPLRFDARTTRFFDTEERTV